MDHQLTINLTQHKPMLHPLRLNKLRHIPINNLGHLHHNNIMDRLEDLLPGLNTNNMRQLQHNAEHISNSMNIKAIQVKLNIDSNLLMVLHLHKLLINTNLTPKAIQDNHMVTRLNNRLLLLKDKPHLNLCKLNLRLNNNNNNKFKEVLAQWTIQMPRLPQCI